MHTRLENFITNNQLDPVATMNRLQGAGVISDNCITAQDVAAVDCLVAITWLLKHQPTDKDHEGESRE